MHPRLKWAIFSAVMTVITGAGSFASLASPGSHATVLGFLSGLNFVCAISQYVLYKQQKDFERDNAALVEQLNKAREDLEKRKGDDYYLSGL